MVRLLDPCLRKRVVMSVENITESETDIKSQRGRLNAELRFIDSAKGISYAGIKGDPVMRPKAITEFGS